MIEIIPAIDLIDGKCVRLSGGKFDTMKIYSDDPVDLARQFRDHGVKYLHVVDLDGARTGIPAHIGLLGKIASVPGMMVDFGGGIRTRESFKTVLDAGADRVSIGSLAVTHPRELEEWMADFGPERVLLGVDVKNEKVAYHGWQAESAIGWQEFIGYWLGKGIDRIFCTDVDRDGAMKGPAVELYQRMIRQFPGLGLIASGGVSGPDDIRNLDESGLTGVIVGKAIYEGKLGSSYPLRLKHTATSTGRPEKEVASGGLAKRIIPCLDIRDGRTVKGINFVDIRDAGDPVELAMRYAAEGADELVFLDITATIEGRKTFPLLVKRIAKVLNIPFTVGGGISTFEDAAVLLEAGADKISLNSAAVKSPEIIDRLARSFGNQFVVLAIDARETVGWEVYVNGGRIPAGRDLFDWAREGQERGCGEILFTSMNHDGTRNGFANEALARLSELLTIPIIASGGAGNMEHFRDAFLLGKADAALAASVFHFGDIPVPELKRYLYHQGITVRI
jgi:phosphoribosylformimino-5-aminoimidazole carboxamide ribotide isomerase